MECLHRCTNCQILKVQKYFRNFQNVEGWSPFYYGYPGQPNVSGKKLVQKSLFTCVEFPDHVTNPCDLHASRGHKHVSCVYLHVNHAYSVFKVIK